MNSAFIRAEKTRSRLPNDNTLYMNPKDIETENLVKGSKVQVASKYGSIEAVLKADPSMSQGVVSTHHLWGTLERDNSDDNPGANVGRLISIDEDLQTINYMPLQSAIPVTVTSV